MLAPNRRDQLWFRAGECSGSVCCLFRERPSLRGAGSIRLSRHRSSNHHHQHRRHLNEIRVSAANLICKHDNGNNYGGFLIEQPKLILLIHLTLTLASFACQPIRTRAGINNNWQQLQVWLVGRPRSRDLNDARLPIAEDGVCQVRRLW